LNINTYEISFHAEGNPGKEEGRVRRRQADHRLPWFGAFICYSLAVRRARMIAAAAAINDDG
jgi:hypothetical protein